MSPIAGLGLIVHFRAAAFPCAMAQITVPEMPRSVSLVDVLQGVAVVGAAAVLLIVGVWLWSRGGGGRSS
jgi:hypothetical protein